MEVKIKKLRTEYKKAVDEGKDMFNIGGLIFVTGYAKYLLEYCEMQGLKDNDDVSITRGANKDAEL